MASTKSVGKQVDIPTDDDVSLQPFTDADGAPATLPEVGGGGEEGKMKILLGLMKKLIGVKDVANLRLSLPASLLEPIPNLEYWQYADRADVFAAIGDSSDELERMLAVLRFSFSKELKFVRARLGKPYNSALGEHFRCSWRLPPIKIDKESGKPIIRTHIHVPVPGEPAYGGAGGSGFSTPVLRPEDGGKMTDSSSIKSTSSKTSRKPSVTSLKLPPASPGMPGPADSGGEESDAGVVDSEKVTVVFLCEQVSHHPPISAAYYTCPEKGIEAAGFDQIAAKVSGMSMKVGPGPKNKGIFVRITRDGPGKGEVGLALSCCNPRSIVDDRIPTQEYQITHPQAAVNGILKGQYYGTISDQISVTCRGGEGKGKIRYRALLDYKDESWIGRPRFLIDGVIYKYDEGKEDQLAWTKAKQVPVDKVVAYLEGNWMKEIRYKMKGEKEWKTLLDLDQLALIPKSVRPLEEQDPHESRKLWDPVTQHLLSKNWGEATREKQRIEQRQRDIASEKKRDDIEHESQFFASEDDDGKPRLSEKGRLAIEEEVKRVKGL